MLKSPRFLPFLLSISFAVFAIARLNESNQHLWVVVYGSFAALSGFAFFRIFHTLTLLTIFSGYIASLFYVIPDLYQNLNFNPEKGYAIPVNDLQNIFGLTICLITLIHYLLLAHKQNVANKVRHFQIHSPK